MQGEANSTENNGMERRGLSEDKLRHVHDHLTPLAAIIVIPGILVASLPTRDAVIAGCLIAFSIVANYTLMYLMQGNRARSIGSARVVINYVVNIALSWLLYAVWGPVWLLLLLMTLGVAIYQPRKDSLLAGLAFALMLLVVHWNFGDQSVLAWTEAGVKASMLILLNLYVNGLMGRQAEAIEETKDEINVSGAMISGGHEEVSTG